MEKSASYLDGNNKNLTIKESYKLEESDFLSLNENTEFLREEIEKITMLLIFRTKLICTEIEKGQDEFWNKVNKTQELSKNDIENYAILKQRLSDAKCFNNKIEDVYSNCERLLEEIQNLLKGLL